MGVIHAGTRALHYKINHFGLLGIKEWNRES